LNIDVVMLWIGLPGLLRVGSPRFSKDPDHCAHRASLMAVVIQKIDKGTIRCAIKKNDREAGFFPARSVGGM
ncbi:MAG: hypothetical protein QNI85_11585, partial [Desulfobacterales bacterium]|nr:hypothetical protein [Desulfobacterales bacterium]